MIKKIEALKLAGYVLTTNMKEVSANNPIPGFWGSLFENNKMENLFKLSGNCITYGVSNMLNETDMEYMVGVLVADDAIVADDMTVFNLPESEYVVFETTLADLPNAYAKSFGWLQQNGYVIASPKSFELYGEDYPSTNKISLHLPVKKA